jgi:hypothetical protein
VPAQEGNVYQRSEIDSLLNHRSRRYSPAFLFPEWRMAYQNLAGLRQAISSSVFAIENAHLDHVGRFQGEIGNGSGPLFPQVEDSILRPRVDQIGCAHGW